MSTIKYKRPPLLLMMDHCILLKNQTTLNYTADDNLRDVVAGGLGWLAESIHIGTPACGWASVCITDGPNKLP